MNPLVNLDEFILGRFQKFSEWTQINYDKNCYWWAFISANMSGIMCLLILFSVYQNANGSLVELQKEWMYIVILLFIASAELFKLPRLKRWSEQSNIQYSFGHYFFRIIWVIYTVVEVNHLNWTGLLPFSWVCIEYFEQCKPLPPSEVKRKQRLLSRKFATT